jgi:hypothetical protein
LKSGEVVMEDITTEIAMASTNGKVMTTDFILMKDTCRKLNMTGMHMKNGRPAEETMRTGIKIAGIEFSGNSPSCLHVLVAFSTPH